MSACSTTPRRWPAAPSTRPPPCGPGPTSAAATRDGDEVLDLTDLICPVDPCPAVVGRVVVFRDNNHLSQEYVQTLRRPFDLRLQEIVGRVLGT